MKKILIVFGTRPEAIKMSPVIHALQGSFNVKICVTAQHREMLDQVLNLFEISTNYDLNLMSSDQDLFDITSRVLLKLKKVLVQEKPDLVLVQGDTTTTLSASIAAFYLQIPVGHVEAGLRTHNIHSPYPEEFNRQVTTRATKYHFAPTEKARENLLNEQVSDENIYVTGNTVIDALFSALKKAKNTNYSNELLKQLPFLQDQGNTTHRIILVTGHRRESFGKGFEVICKSLQAISQQHPDVQIVYPVHLNPNVQKPVNEILSNIKNVHLLKPMDYLPFLKLMDDCYLILTDSGGIQEEAPSLGKPVLVMRSITERPEAVEAGTVKLVGTNLDKIVNISNQLLSDDVLYKQMSKAHNPYGDGLSSQRICKVLQEADL